MRNEEAMLASTRDTCNCFCRLYACIVIKNYTKIQGPQFEFVMRTWHIISLIAENKPHAHHKTLLHTINVYNTCPVSLC